MDSLTLERGRGGDARHNDARQNEEFLDGGAVEAKIKTNVKIKAKELKKADGLSVALSEAPATRISSVGRVERGRTEDDLPSVDTSCLYNRALEIAWHIPWYGFKTQARLAQDSGVSPAAVSRLIRGHSQPTLGIALRVAAALSRRLGRQLDVGEVFSLDGSFPTPSVCNLTGCRNCLPPTAYDQHENLRPEYRDTDYSNTESGHWSRPVANRKGGR